MNDDTDKPLNPVGDAALEARITAWVLGEASPFEAAELEEICARDAEARLFERRLRVLHGFIAGDRNAGPDEEWKLPPEKRARIEELFEKPEPVKEEVREQPKIVQRGQAGRRERHGQTGRRALMALAACTVISAAGWVLFSAVGDSSRREIAMLSDVGAPAPGVDRESRQRALDELRKAVIAQEDAVEDKRKLLSQIIRTENIIYRGDPSIGSGARGFTSADDAESAAEAYVDLEQQKIQLESQLGSLARYDGDQLLNYASGLSLPDNVLPVLQPQLQELKRQYSVLKEQGVAENHPKLQAQAQMIEGMEKDMTEAVGNVRETLKAKVSLSNEQLARLKSRMDVKEGDAVRQGIANQSFVDAKNDFESNQRQLEQLRVKLISEEMKMKNSDDLMLMADAAIPSMASGGGGSGGGRGSALRDESLAIELPAASAAKSRGPLPTPSAPMAAPAPPAQPPADMDALAAIDGVAAERKAEGASERGESRSQLAGELATRRSKSSTTAPGEKGEAAFKSPATSTLAPGKPGATDFATAKSKPVVETAAESAPGGIPAPTTAPTEPSGAVAMNGLADREALGKNMALQNESKPANLEMDGPAGLERTTTATAQEEASQLQAGLGGRARESGAKSDAGGMIFPTEYEPPVGGAATADSPMRPGVVGAWDRFQAGDQADTNAPSRTAGNDFSGWLLSENGEADSAARHASGAAADSFFDGGKQQAGEIPVLGGLFSTEAKPSDRGASGTKAQHVTGYLLDPFADGAKGGLKSDLSYHYSQADDGGPHPDVMDLAKMGERVKGAGEVPRFGMDLRLGAERSDFATDGAGKDVNWFTRDESTKELADAKKTGLADGGSLMPGFDGFTNMGSPITGKPVEGQSGLAQEEMMRSKDAVTTLEKLNEPQSMLPEAAGAQKQLADASGPQESRPESAQQTEELRNKLSNAEGNYKLGKFDDARRTYEDVLRTDPNNQAARRGIESVAQAKSDYDRAAYDQTRAQLLAEVDRAWEVPVPEAEAASARSATSIRDLRETIIIPEVDFEDATVEEALDFIRVRAAEYDTHELDPAKKGVPIVLAKPAEGSKQVDPSKLKIEKLQLKGAKLGEVLNEVARASGLELAYEDHAVVFRAGPNTPTQADVIVNLMDETVASAEPFSTFSLHVSDASFKMAKAAMERGEVPAADGIRPEEFYNAFDYGDPAPANGEPVVCAVEQSAHPALPQRNLLRIGVKTGSQGRGGSTPLNLTLLLDSSGSMEREDRNAGLANAVGQLAGLLKEGDTVSVIGFARQPRLLVDRLPGNRAQELNAIFAQTPPEGGTNLEEGIKLGEQLAMRQFNPAAQNRIVLFTDGAANLGDAKPETLQAKVEQMRQNGIAFDAAGFGTDGLNDKLLERLTRNGNGRYYIVDRAEDADANFAKQLAGAFRPAAENVKVQVRFNPARVAKYKLIGFEEHRLKKEDFRNDAVDAAEMAAEEAGNALYQIETLPQGEGEVGEVSVRFRDAASGQMVERTWTIPYEAQAASFDQATPSIQLAGLAAFAAEKLRAAPMADAIDFQQLAPVMAKVKARYASSKPVADLESMIGKLK